MSVPKRSGSTSGRTGGPEVVSNEFSMWRRFGTSTDRRRKKAKPCPSTELDRDQDDRLELEKTDDKGPLNDRGRSVLALEDLLE